MDPKPIPAFYCCYLLRSTKCPKAAPYVGSTPNPVRRLAQHNGHGNGGAVRTSRKDRRPWQMTVIVTGFPSRIAALQFEWAWENAHLTKKISKEQRITFPKKPQKGQEGQEEHMETPKAFRKRKRKPNLKPTSSLQDKLKNLHLLLRVPSFERWPLHVRFFCDDVYEKWRAWNDQVNGSISSHTMIVLGFKQPDDGKHDEIPPSAQAKGKQKPEMLGNDDINVGYGALKGHLEKSKSIFAGDAIVDCTVCRKSMGAAPKMALVCPKDNCRTASHVGCLATRFLEDDTGNVSVVPISGTCPGCEAELQWIELVKEMSLRIRGQKEVARLMKKPRGGKAKECKTAEVDANDHESEALDVGGDDAVSVAEDMDDLLPDNWYYQEDDDDMMSVTSVTSAYSDNTGAPAPKKAHRRRRD